MKTTPRHQSRTPTVGWLTGPSLGRTATDGTSRSPPPSTPTGPAGSRPPQGNDRKQSALRGAGDPRSPFSVRLLRQNRTCRILSVQKASQRLAIVVLGLLGHAGIRYPVETVIRPRIHVELDRHPGAAQSIRIDHVFFQEEIKTTDRNVGWRQARHIRCSCSRRIRRDVGRSRLFAKQRTPSEIVVLLRPDELADVRMQVLAHRRAVIDHRIDQMLEGEFWSLSVAGVEYGSRRETAPSAFALDPDPGGTKPEPSCILG